MFENLSKAAQRPTPDNVLAAIRQSIATFERLTDAFPNNQNFREKLEVLTAAETRVQDLALTPGMPQAARLTEIREIEALFKKAGARQIDLTQWGLLD